MTTPFVGWDFNMASGSGRKGCFVLRSKVDGLELKGGMHTTKLADGCPALLFLGAPRLGNLTDLTVGRGVRVSEGVDGRLPVQNLLCPLTPCCPLPFVAKDHDLFLVDIPTHDMSSDLVVMAERRRAEEAVTQELLVGSPDTAVAAAHLVSAFQSS